MDSNELCTFFVKIITGNQILEYINTDELQFFTFKDEYVALNESKS